MICQTSCSVDCTKSHWRWNQAIHVARVSVGLRSGTGVDWNHYGVHYDAVGGEVDQVGVADRDHELKTGDVEAFVVKQHRSPDLLRPRVRGRERYGHLRAVLLGGTLASDEAEQDKGQSREDRDPLNSCAHHSPLLQCRLV